MRRGDKVEAWSRGITDCKSQWMNFTISASGPMFSEATIQQQCCKTEKKLQEKPGAVFM